jgi:hypothetical protein
MAECERTGRLQGLSAGLAVALADPAVLGAAPGRYAAVPAALAPDGAAVLRHRLADHEGVVFLPTPGGGRVDACAAARTGRLLAAVRLGDLRRTLDAAVEHLSHREAGGEPLIRKQLITGTVADVMAGVEFVRAFASASGEPAAVADVHDRLDDLGWQVVTLFGAAGYLADHPARALYVSALVANAWVDRTGDHTGDRTGAEVPA